MFYRISHASASLSQFQNRKWPVSLLRWTVSNRAPEYHVTDTNYDTIFAPIGQPKTARPMDLCNFLFPFWTQTPQGAFDRVNSRAWVPMDDTHTMFLSLSWRARRPVGIISKRPAP
jgi:phthalate 4,5-dioxygenase